MSLHQHHLWTPFHCTKSSSSPHPHSTDRRRTRHNTAQTINTHSAHTQAVGRNYSTNLYISNLEGIVSTSLPDVDV